MDRRTPQAFLGNWRIEEMEVWGPDYLDLVVPAHLTFDDESIGSFQFGTVAGGLDCRFDESGAKARGSSRPRVQFSWEGQNDTDPGCGRGVAVMTAEDVLEGRIFIHCGDDSAFRAVRVATRAEGRAVPTRPVKRRPTKSRPVRGGPKVRTSR